MSGEFAWVHGLNNYAHRGIERLIDAMDEDCEYPPTKVFIDFMDTLSMVMHDIADVEAGDSSYDAHDLSHIDDAIEKLRSYRASVADTLHKLATERKR